MGLGTAVGAGRLAAGGAHTQLGVSRAYRWTGLGTPIVFLHGGGMTSVSDAQPAG
jgi:pimeloyl-ACP methyl ester carboxylesterase